MAYVPQKREVPTNIDILDFTWKYNQAAAGMLLAQYEGKTNTAEARRDCLLKDVGFRTARRTVSQQLAYYTTDQYLPRFGSELWNKSE